MKQRLILISIDMWQYHKSTRGKRSLVCGKLKVSSVLSLVVNGEIHKEPNKSRRDFFFKRMLSQETAAT